MDASVIASVARWPNVPHVYGWLSLDRRGKWRLQDSPISHELTCEFIGRNYEHDERGAWFFQNGPQRVYIELAYTPWVLRFGNDRKLLTHTGLIVDNVQKALLDEEGNLLLVFERGVGLVDDRDLPTLLDRIHDAGGSTASESAITPLMKGKPNALWLSWQGRDLPLVPIRADEVALRYGFIATPQAS